NLGQFAREGFDLCATPRCQAYEGVKVEHPLSDKAVTETRGEVLVYQGTPIDALYTATCGGHTEDGAAVFADKKGLPYLKGVPCREEDAGGRAVDLTGPPQVPIIDATATDVTLAWAWLRAAGVLRDEDAQGTLSGKRLHAWTRALAERAGLPAPSAHGGAAATFGEAAAAVASGLGWDKRAQVLLLPGDAEALLRDTAPEASRRTLGYLAWMEAVHPRPDGSFGWDAPPEAARLAALLARIAESYDALDLQEGVLGGAGETGLRVVRSKETVTLTLAPGAVLFGWAGGRALPVTRLRLLPGDRLRWHRDEAGRADVLELRPPVKGVADDRSAVLYTWEVRKTRRELEETIGKRIRVGTLRDLKVVRRGVSGRIVALEVVGSRGKQTVRGFDVRNLLDLRETLAAFEIQRDGAGEITAVAFHGKGWGHGVGLCQVGAYGMALRGEGYRAILAHYYPGTMLSSPP
ncbi:MAG TPA: SpoIID/LytB domain-containing protein, partial [Candidatus Polarisedimenticolaceae bacterium]|nr:SpoIID/LytB domain-containing protein [Candidatus Polarisedimenticolaceae bacterium]